MASVRVHFNTKCLKCGTVKEEMISVGPMVFCHYCYIDEFENIEEEGKVNSSNPIYKK